MIDGEHSTNSLETITEMVRAVDAGSADREVGSIVRLSENDATEIKRVLDSGVSGVMAR